MYNVEILTSDEMRSEVYNFDDMPEYKGAELFIISNNEENPYEGVIYENGEMWVFGAKYDSKMATLEDMLDQIVSGD